MKVEVAPNGIVKIDTDAQQALAGVYPIHLSKNDDGLFGNADHTALEIRDAINASMLPVLFVEDDPCTVPCQLNRVVSHDDEIEAYEFCGWASWAGKYCIAVDREGNTSLPK